MPRFEFDLETFTTVAIDAPDEAAARSALESVLQALSDAEHVIGQARCADPRVKVGKTRGRPADSRRKLPAMLQLRSEGLGAAMIAKRLGVHRGTVHRVLKWADARSKSAER